MKSYFFRTQTKFINLLHKFVVITLLLISVSAVATPNIPLNFDGWIIDALNKLEISGIIGGFHRHSLPLSRDEVAKIISRADNRINSGEVTISPIDRKLLEKLKSEFQSEITYINLKETQKQSLQKTSVRGQPEIRLVNDKIAPALQSGFHYAVGNSNQFNVYAELEVSNFDQQQDFVQSYSLPELPPLLKSAEQRYETWHWDYVIDFKRAYLQYSLMTFGDLEINILAGRDYVYWGSSPYKSVGISDNSPPFEQLRLTGRIPCKIGTLKATAFTAQLNSTWHDDGTTRYLAKRYLSAHRIDYQFSDWLEIGIAEWVLYGGDVQSVKWHYLNPILPYYAVQYNAKNDDNIMLSFDAAFRPINGVRLYAEWLADDFQYQSDSNDPHATSWLTGIEWYPQFTERKLGIHSEYVKVNRWAYTHLDPDNQFTHFGTMIGHPIGTDADLFSLRLSYQATPSSVIETGVSHQRNGEAGITDRFYGEDFENIPFPSGVVEALTEIRIGWNYRPLTGLKGSAFYAWRNTQNLEHKESETKQQHRLVMLLSYVWGK